MNTLMIEDTEAGEMVVNIYQKLSSNRILFINDEISDTLATDIVATLLLKDIEDSNTKITLFINSVGGDIRNIFSIYDTMKLLECPIETVCIGAATDGAALILAAGTKGMRFITKNAYVSLGHLVHEYTRYCDLTDAKSALDLSTSDNKKYMTELSKCCNKPYKKFYDTYERTTFLNAQQAVKAGLVDSIVKTAKDKSDEE